MKISSSKRKQLELDFDSLLKDLIAKHGVIFLASIDGLNFIYKPLNRKDYKTIVENDNLSIFEKEDEVCAATILWPEDIDWDEIEAGIPTKLYEEILTNSFLDSPESVAHLIDIYREELELLDTQMGCIISEAFPNYDIEEIESWDMIKFCKIFSRAEWKLKNLRKMDDIKDVTDYLREINDGNSIDEEEQNTLKEKINVPEANNQSQKGNRKIKVGSREMTEEEYKQYLEIQKMYPDINWAADAMFTGYETQTINTVPVALR